MPWALCDHRMDSGRTLMMTSMREPGCMGSNSHMEEQFAFRNIAEQSGGLTQDGDICAKDEVK